MIHQQLDLTKWNMKRSSHRLHLWMSLFSSLGERFFHLDRSDWVHGIPYRLRLESVLHLMRQFGAVSPVSVSLEPVNGSCSLAERLLLGIPTLKQTHAGGPHSIQTASGQQTQQWMSPYCPGTPCMINSCSVAMYLFQHQHSTAPSSRWLSMYSPTSSLWEMCTWDPGKPAFSSPGCFNTSHCDWSIISRLSM